MILARLSLVLFFAAPVALAIDQLRNAHSNTPSIGVGLPMTGNATRFVRQERKNDSAVWAAKLVACFAQYFAPENPLRLPTSQSLALDPAKPSNGFVLAGVNGADYADPIVVTPRGVFQVPLLRSPNPAFVNENMTGTLNEGAIVEIAGAGWFRLRFPLAFKQRRDTNAVVFEPIKRPENGSATLNLEPVEKAEDKSTQATSPVRKLFSDLKTAALELEWNYEDLLASLDDAKWAEIRKTRQAEIDEQKNAEARRRLQSELTRLEAARKKLLSDAAWKARLEKVKAVLVPKLAVDAKPEAVADRQKTIEERDKKLYGACIDAGLWK